MADAGWTTFWSALLRPFVLLALLLAIWPIKASILSAARRLPWLYAILARPVGIGTGWFGTLAAIIAFVAILALGYMIDRAR